ncbi:hypothetical protein [Luteolibacter soli]|uniref:Uncharacterized protein n=1 Tax=Luteolibacter soli TaxID=3135280 RepID=A0ABU9B282_9BACT
MSTKVAPAKRTTVASRRHYHRPTPQKQDSWESWVGDRRSRYGRWEWYFALVIVATVAGLIVWRVV